MSSTLFDSLPPGIKRSLKFRVVNPGRFVLDLAQTGIKRAVGAEPKQLRALFISDGAAPTSEEQLSPFRAQRERLRDELGLISMHILVDDALRMPAAVLSSFDVLFLKLWFMTPADEAEDIVRRIAERRGTAKLVYMDGDDDSAVQWPAVLPHCDLYVKKHLFRDRSTYQKTFVGKSNLTDYVHREFGVSFEDDPIPHSVPVPTEQMSKLMLGYNLALDAKIRGLYPELFERGASQQRSNDVVCRATVNEESWLFQLRKGIPPALEAMADEWKVVAPTWRVPQDEYYREMLTSKLCISPLGYGEICWRDFEAILCGCLVLKPDMGHIETHPDIFVPGETYVPLRWDYGDLADKCEQYLRDEPERQRIVANARRVLSDFYEGRAFIDKVEEILAAVGLEPAWTSTTS